MTEDQGLSRKGENIVRKNVLRLVEADGRPRRVIAKAAGIDPSRFSRFLLDKGGITIDEVFGLAAALDVPTRTVVSLPGEPVREPRLIPAVYLRSFPATAEPSEALDKMIAFRHRWEETYRADPRAFALDLLERFLDCLPQDVLIMSDSQPAQAQDIVLVSVDGQAQLGTYLLVDGRPAALLASGQIRTDFVYRGRMIELIRRR